ncbi:MAG: hypothetical protein ACYC7D_12505 [Nitrososphaerales archaeon]
MKALTESGKKSSNVTNGSSLLKWPLGIDRLHLLLHILNKQSYRYSTFWEITVSDSISDLLGIEASAVVVASASGSVIESRKKTCLTRRNNPPAYFCIQ